MRSVRLEVIVVFVFEEVLVSKQGEGQVNRFELLLMEYDGESVEDFFCCNELTNIFHDHATNVR
jgi:hypothetical protein